jgi:UDP-2,4-diacetamido-2,4,6-trideoxy-beta-L-altropyranose hydrolase
MKVAIRTDASLGIGTGHVMRCLTLANAMAGRGATVMFICGKEVGHLCDLIEEAGFVVGRLPADESHRTRWQQDAEESLNALRHLAFEPDLLVVDKYNLDAQWERTLRARARRILVIDDLANRMHDCDILLDPNLHDSPKIRYTGLVGAKTRIFVGPQYALLRPEFERVAPRTRDQGVKKMLAFFGGSDPSNEAMKLVRALGNLGKSAPQTILVLGPVNPRAQEIRQAAAGLADIELIGATNEMARLMAEADLALGTCGGAAWERCLLGLPALVVVSAENQRDDARILHSLGAVRNLGEAAQISERGWALAIAAIQADPDSLTAMSRSAHAVMRGRKEALREFESALVH